MGTLKRMVLLLVAVFCSTVDAVASGAVKLFPNFLDDPDALVAKVNSIPASNWTVADIKNSIKYSGKLEANEQGVKNPSCDFYIGPAAQDLAPIFSEIVDVKEGELVQVFFGRYRRGHFMHVHDDDAVNKINGKLYRRKQAFILYLSKNWTAEDGGELVFFPAGLEKSSESILPEYNTLATFKVGLMHQVLEVTAPQGKDRVTVYGWLMREETAFEAFTRTPFYHVFFSSKTRTTTSLLGSIGLMLLLRMLAKEERERSEQVRESAKQQKKVK